MSQDYIGKTEGFALAAIAIVVLGVGLWVYNKGLKGASSTIAKGAVDAAAGTVEGLAEGVGIPKTDTDQCAAAMAAGDAWNASLYCPATTFIKWVAMGRPKTIEKQLVNNADAVVGP